MKKPRQARWVGWYNGKLREMLRWSEVVDGEKHLYTDDGPQFVSRHKIVDRDRRIEILVRELPKKGKGK